MMTANEIRDSFKKYFESKGHAMNVGEVLRANELLEKYKYAK